MDLSADMRYRGQAYELLVPWSGAIDAAGLVEAVEAFHAMHLERFAHEDREGTTEIATLRLVARGLLPKLDAAAKEAGGAAGAKGAPPGDG
ncbi:MAG: hypothetical protein ACKVGZ_02040, partial [Alphaproteobacteria bacterium]